ARQPGTGQLSRAETGADTKRAPASPIMRRRTGIVLALAALLAVAISALRHRQASAPVEPALRCFTTGGGALRVCHAASDEGVYYRPPSTAVAYNVQIIRYQDQRHATVLHSEAQDSAHYHSLAGHVRPGDSIKAGTVDATRDPAAVYSVPRNL